MNRNQYCCQRCGNLKYDWSGNLCPECLERDRLRREGKKYFGMFIKMREATKEEKQGVDEYIQSISEKVYTKDEVVAMLTGLKTEIDIMSDTVVEGRTVTVTSWKGMQKRICKLIQSKIDKLEGNTDGTNS